MATVAETLEMAASWEQVFAHRAKRLENGCLHFVGARLPSGYGKVGYRKTNWLAHRLSLHLHLRDDLGTPLNSQVVMHTCDDPQCIEPEHLLAVTAAENTADMIAKGRAGWQLYPERFTGGRPPRMRGEQNPSCRFPDSVALDIIQKRAKGATYNALMREYAASKSTIATICKRRQFPERTQAEVVSALRAAAAKAREVRS